MTITNKQCEAFGSAIRAKVEEFFAPRIAETQTLIDAEIAAGRNPEEYEIQGGMVKINLRKLLKKINDMKELGMTNAELHENACDKDAVPNWIGDATKVADIALAIAMLPMILLTGNLAMAHVDLGEVYKGKVFGGNDAFVPKLRDDLLDELGVRGDVRAFINDPFNETNKFFASGLEGLKNFLEKPFG